MILKSLRIEPAWRTAKIRHTPKLRIKRLESHLVKMVWPTLASMNQRLDRRLVNTFLGLAMGFIKHRHRNNGLLLSELGGYVRQPVTAQTFVREIHVPGAKAEDNEH
jgi:hypothetical protein